MFWWTLMFCFCSRNTSILMDARHDPLSGANADLLKLGFNVLGAPYSCIIVHAHSTTPEFRCMRSRPYTAANVPIKNSQLLRVPIWNPSLPHFYAKSPVTVIIKAGTLPCSGASDMTHILSLRTVLSKLNATLSFVMSPS